MTNLIIRKNKDGSKADKNHPFIIIKGENISQERVHSRRAYQIKWKEQATRCQEDRSKGQNVSVPSYH